MNGIVKAICTSAKRGTVKTETDAVLLREHYGIEGDAHAGDWHRQISLLDEGKVRAFNERGGNAVPGSFGENILTEGVDWAALPMGSIVRFGTASGQTNADADELVDAISTANGPVLRLTQRGKECHTHCEIYKRVGDCIMPREGIFAEVLQGGRLRVGDGFTVELPAADRPFTAAVITVSDKGSRGERVDESGPKAVEILTEAGYEVVETLIVPDEEALIAKELKRLADQREVELILTSGGTGFSLRDRTPEATLAVADRNAPGIAEAIRAYSMRFTNRAMLSRGASVLRGQSLIVNLPGSPKAVAESLEGVLPALGHGLAILRGSAAECARRD
ncbi:MAG: MOSC domain-containing protein [Firmicutes bacterium]|nr:MOSC domain-containing protein [Bacillota bacterium]